MSPATSLMLAALLLAVTGVSHLMRPEFWRKAVARFDELGEAGLAMYAALHIIPVFLLAGALPPDSAIEWALTLLAAVYLLKAATMLIWPALAHRSMQRGIELSTAAWRAPGVFLIAASVLAGAEAIP